jgi:hypothetical protein
MHKMISCVKSHFKIQKLCLILSVFAVILTAGCENKNLLFTGKDLTGWGAFPGDKTFLWSVKNGIIHCDGTANSYLRSDKQYTHYHLHLEWRWPKSPGNSSVAVHTIGWDKLWPDSIEISLNAGTAGDMYLIGESLTVSKFDIVIRSDLQLPTRIPKQLNSSENLTGEWNSLDIFCKNADIQVFINGFLQNEIFGPSRNSGSICLTNKDSPVEFRNIYMNPMPQ